MCRGVSWGQGDKMIIARLTYPDVVGEARGSAARWSVVEDDFGHWMVLCFDDGGVDIRYRSAKEFSNSNMISFLEFLRRLL